MIGSRITGCGDVRPDAQRVIVGRLTDKPFAMSETDMCLSAVSIIVRNCSSEMVEVILYFPDEFYHVRLEHGFFAHLRPA